ncbi:hypothetical protein JMJ56_18625 [Belnapia sp. T18]|uniref:Uncharacterized protein n=1 Tax=Belnapia arida TaxID=2804533 RepID=A0ABS1U655_9PROT|nr:hypothetical protein [Belnapia arida]MBL6080040.1 hypothetical protein [Belnapia arida]
MDMSVEVRRLLTELAFIACTQGRTDQARCILVGLEAARPGSLEVRIGSALAALTDGRAEDAVAGLRPLAEAGDGYGAAFLVLALRLAGHGSEADATAARAQHRGGDPAAAALLSAKP